MQNHNSAANVIAALLTNQLPTIHCADKRSDLWPVHVLSACILALGHTSYQIIVP